MAKKKLSKTEVLLKKIAILSKTYAEEIATTGGPQVLELTVTMSDASAADLARVAPQIRINNGAATAMTGSGGIFTANLTVGDNYEITFNSLVSYGYKSPSTISGTYQGGRQQESAIYQTTVYTVGIQTTVDGSVQGSNVSGAEVSVNYTGGTAQTKTSGQTVKVPANLTPTATPAAVEGYSTTTPSVTDNGDGTGTISFQYQTVTYTLSITSNQTGDNFSQDTATLTYTYNGATVTRQNVAQGTVYVPASATNVAFAAADKAGYAKTVSGASISYATCKLSVSLASDTGEADLSGVTVTVRDTTADAAVTKTGDYYLIPGGHGYSVAGSDDVEGYSAPSAQTGTAGSGADATASVTLTYEEAAGFVDLGLTSGTKWAVGNIVSDGNGGYTIGEETDYGAYVSWGNVTPHFSSNGSTFDDSYDWGTSNSGPYASTPGASISGLSQGESFSETSGYDAARELLGGAWKMPTTQQFKELYDETDSEWTTINGVAGRKFMKKTDHSVYVFFPAAGHGGSTSLVNRSSYGYYWSRSWYSSDYGYGLYFYSGGVNPQYRGNRYYGFSVRAVQ